MSNNGMIEYKENFITKIKSFFKGLFGINGKKYNYFPEKDENSIIEEKQERQNGFIDNIKADSKAVNFVIDKKNFLEKINGNEEALSMLSIGTLKRLEKYYDNVIEENDKIIKKLKRTV